MSDITELQRLAQEVASLTHAIGQFGQAFLLTAEAIEHMQSVLNEIHKAVADNRPKTKSPLFDKVDGVVQAVRDCTEVCRQLPDRVSEAIHQELTGRNA